MFSKILSGSLYGLNAGIVAVEADLSGGLPAFQVVGLPDASVRESKERIRAAIRNAGFVFPTKKITINLSPANTRKEGTQFDLPIAAGILSASGQLNIGSRFESFACLGELSLDGRVKSIKGALPLVIGLRNAGVTDMILPSGNISEASIVDHVRLYPVTDLSEVAGIISGSEKREPCIAHSAAACAPSGEAADFGDVAGQESVKRALQIAAAAFHNILMIGSPGSGKTMMANRLPSILPPLSYDEKLEITQIYSIAGELTDRMPVIDWRQFRSPHHSISRSALVGGGMGPKPGEISLAHHGVLFLDELPEFDRRVLEALRQPMENERVSISRSAGVVSYPSKFLFAASMNPCPCGYYGDGLHECTCTASQISNYMAKISGPLMDRIDIHIEVPTPGFSELCGASGQKSSADMREDVARALDIQHERYINEEITYNSQLTPALIRKYCVLDMETRKLLEGAFTRLKLSARAYTKIIRLSRTIADLEGEEDIRVEHVAEAIGYRSLDRRFKA